VAAAKWQRSKSGQKQSMPAISPVIYICLKRVHEFRLQRPIAGQLFAVFFSQRD
jgi:hypothetical protein